MDRDGADGGLGIPGPGELPGVARFSHEAMATVFEVYAEHPDTQYAAQAAQAAFGRTDRLEGELSRFLPNSDIGRINRLAAGERTRVGTSAMECLVIARHMFELTGGAFDVSVGTGLSSLDLDPDNLIVAAGTDRVRIDLGGIGKGYAVDRMAGLLEEWGIARALVIGGFSSVLALDAPEGQKGWRLTLSDPGVSSRVLAHLCVRQTALGASGVRKGAHIVDPRTGEAASGRRAAWGLVPRPEASAPDLHGEPGPGPSAAAVTDALTTAFMLMKVDAIEALCEGTPGLEAWVLAEPVGEQPGQAPLLHFGGGGSGYTSTSP